MTEKTVFPFDKADALAEIIGHICNHIASEDGNLKVFRVLERLHQQALVDWDKHRLADSDDPGHRDYVAYQGQLIGLTERILNVQADTTGDDQAKGGGVGPRVGVG